MEKKEVLNPLLCDPEKGVCEIPENQTTNSSKINKTTSKAVQIIYFTDPICSSCWGIEPQLRKLKLEYGDNIEISYHMGGLLPSWDIYNSGGISEPSDVAYHWDEVSHYYEMPIDGNIWLEDPLSSSYPPSIAFKAAQLQDKEKALVFLRKIREMVFLEKKNITKWEYLQQAAIEAGLDSTAFKKDYEGKAKVLFQEDLELAGKLHVRGFPTLFFTNATSNKLMVYGFKPYEMYEETVLQLFPQALKKEIDTSWESLFDIYPTLTTKEFSVLTGKTMKESKTFLDKLYHQEKLNKEIVRNGILWKK